MLSHFGQIPLTGEGYRKLVGGRNAMKVFLKAGARGWIETQVNGPTLIRFAEDITIEVEHCRRHWYRTKGQVANLAVGHPPILINEIHLSKETG
jgi:hypothetical protein